MHNPRHALTRHYNASWGVPGLSQAEGWLSVDPLAEKYPSHSAYNYCMNNPVMLVDPDGREIFVNGKTYSYQENRDYSKLNNKFERNTFMALDHLYKEKAMVVNVLSKGITKNVDVLNVLIKTDKAVMNIV